MQEHFADKSIYALSEKRFQNSKKLSPSSIISTFWAEKGSLSATFEHKDAKTKVVATRFHKNKRSTVLLFIDAGVGAVRLCTSGTFCTSILYVGTFVYVGYVFFKKVYVLYVYVRL